MNVIGKPIQPNKRYVTSTLKSLFDDTNTPNCAFLGATLAGKTSFMGKILTVQNFSPIPIFTQKRLEIIRPHSCIVESS